jgi:tetratricopeptide (TPR) repeat protein
MTPSDRVKEIVEYARAIARGAAFSSRGSDPAYAIQACDHALALLRPLGRTETLADVLRWKGNILRDSGDHTSAMDLFAESLGVADAMSYKLGRAHALNCIGTMAQYSGDMRRAVSCYEAARVLAGDLDDQRLLGMIEQNLGIVAVIEGRPDDGLRHFRRAKNAFEEIGDVQALHYVLNNLGHLYTLERKYDLATATLFRALQLAQSLNDIASEGIVWENQARLLLATGFLGDAQDAAKRALEIAEQRGDRTRQAAALYALARIIRQRDDTSPHVLTVLNRALDLAQTGQDAELKGEITREMVGLTEPTEPATLAVARARPSPPTCRETPAYAGPRQSTESQERAE